MNNATRCAALLKYSRYAAYAAILLAPALASADVSIGVCIGDCNGFGGILNTILDIINNVLVPLIFAVAFIVFIFGIFRYFIAGAADAESRKAGGQLVLYGIIGFAIMISIWGLVNIATNTFGLDNSYHPPFPTL